MLLEMLIKMLTGGGRLACLILVLMIMLGILNALIIYVKKLSLMVLVVSMEKANDLILS
jgi:hypothetical protein